MPIWLSSNGYIITGKVTFPLGKENVFKILLQADHAADVFCLQRRHTRKTSLQEIFKMVYIITNITGFWNVKYNINEATDGMVSWDN